MFNKIDLRELAKLTAPDRAFLSLYLSGPKALDGLDRRIKQTKSLLADNQDEAEYLKENITLVKKYLEDNPFETGGLCIFACWALDYFQAWPLPASIPDLLWVDSSPYIRPLAKLQDEYENFAVVVADNKVARIFLVGSDKARSEERIKGDIKNHVRKGGWSQQRYERRRDKQLLLYAKEIVKKLAELDQEEDFRRVIMVGAKETLAEIRDVLPKRLAKKLVGEKALDLGKGDKWIDKEIFDIFQAEERLSEKRLWERIKSVHLHGRLAAVGAHDVLIAAKAGRVETMIINKGAKISGKRCRDCEHLAARTPRTCPNCGSESLFEIDLVNELVELAATTSAEAEFIEPLPDLASIGDIAALLRY